MRSVKYFREAREVQVMFGPAACPGDIKAFVDELRTNNKYRAVLVGHCCCRELPTSTYFRCDPEVCMGREPLGPPSTTIGGRKWNLFGLNLFVYLPFFCYFGKEQLVIFGGHLSRKFCCCCLLLFGITINFCTKKFSWSLHRYKVEFSH